jgi:hypothetical protein
MSVIPINIRNAFFEYLFGNKRGYICVCTAPAENPRSRFRQHFFAWPEQKDEVHDFVEKAGYRGNVWFGVNLLSRDQRAKEFCIADNLVWSDLDTCDPAKVEPIPSVLIQSSPGRYQAIWRLNKDIPPELAEDYSKRIAYKYRQDGADPTGWDLTQLLRVPFTYNHKYRHEGSAPPQVRLIHSHDALVPVELFEAIEPAPAGQGEFDFSDVPDLTKLPTAEQVIYKYQGTLRNTAFASIFGIEPDIGDDWSRILWRLINVCLECGLNEEETFAVCMEAKCNKYIRDKRPPRYLWREVKKASQGHQRLTVITGDFISLTMPEIIAEDYEPTPGIMEEYAQWAKIATDAVPEYHELSIFILISSLISANLELHTSYGPIFPNLWGLILGDSTLTRKTTAMRMVTDLMQEIDDELILATDGSAEGLLTGLSTRPNRVSLFYKDEVSGFFDSINRKDYLAGMPEVLTHLYDVPRIYTRRLRKDTIVVTNPFLIFFGGGIRDKVYSLIDDQYILSGFLPRFLVVSGEADLSRIRTTGPAPVALDEQKVKLIHKISDIYQFYNRESAVTLAGQQIMTPIKHRAILTDKAWETYGGIELLMVREASQSAVAMLAMPTFERLSRSLLKMSLLLAASRQEPEESTLEVTELDVLHAASYVQRWGTYSVDLVLNAGKSSTQHTLDRVRDFVNREPGVWRSKVMRQFHFTRREADEIVGTLIERGEISAVKKGKGYELWPM